MSENNIKIAENYYKAMGKKDINEIASYLQPNARLKSPFTEIEGKDKMLEAIKGFMTSFDSLNITAKFGSVDGAMLAFDMKYPEPIGSIRASSLVAINDGLISSIELFFDARVFEKK